MADALFAARNQYYIGAYNNAITEASDLAGLTEAEQIERDVLVYRSYIALGSHDLVISEIKDDARAPMALQAVKLLAQYDGGRVTPEAALETIAGWLEDPLYGSNATVLLVAGTVFAREGNHVEALKACHSGASLEMLALCVQVYLAMNRPDKAEAAAKAMSQADDDATVTQLASAWAGVALGGAKVQEASYIYQELGDKFGWTAPLHNGLAVCHMRMGEWEDAERDLQEALAKDAKHADTLANLVTVGLHLGKSTARFASQLKVVAPQHPLVARAAAGEEAFERAAAAAQG